MVSLKRENMFQRFLPLKQILEQRHRQDFEPMVPHQPELVYLNVNVFLCVHPRINKNEKY